MKERDKNKWIELLAAVSICVLVFLCSSYFQLFEKFIVFSREHESWQLDEIISVLISLNAIFLVMLFIRWEKTKIINKTIKKLLAEKELVLKEVHHRIKNNISVMKGLLLMSESNQGKDGGHDAIKETITRIDSMGILYDKLYLSENYREIDIQGYLQQLINEIRQLYSSSNLFEIQFNIDDFLISNKKASKIGLITNELITNSIKHAFSDDFSGTIYFSVSLNNDLVKMVYEDNGIGIVEDNSDESGFGLNLIKILTKDLDGTCQIERNNGIKFVIEFKR